MFYVNLSTEEFIEFQKDIVKCPIISVSDKSTVQDVLSQCGVVTIKFEDGCFPRAVGLNVIANLPPSEQGDKREQQFQAILLGKLKADKTYPKFPELSTEESVYLGLIYDDKTDTTTYGLVLPHQTVSNHMTFVAPVLPTRSSYRWLHHIPVSIIKEMDNNIYSILSEISSVDSEYPSTAVTAIHLGFNFFDSIFETADIFEILDIFRRHCGDQPERMKQPIGDYTELEPRILTESEYWAHDSGVIPSINLMAGYAYYRSYLLEHSQTLPLISLPLIDDKETSGYYIHSSCLESEGKEFYLHFFRLADEDDEGDILILMNTHRGNLSDCTLLTVIEQKNFC
jgi:hypothetical protein